MRPFHGWARSLLIAATLFGCVAAGPHDYDWCGGYWASLGYGTCDHACVNDVIQDTGPACTGATTPWLPGREVSCPATFGGGCCMQSHVNSEAQPGVPEVVFWDCP